MKPLLAILALLCCFFSGWSQIGAKVKNQQTSTLTGIWTSSYNGLTMTLMLNPDGNGEFDGEALSYSTNANTLTLRSQAGTTAYQYKQAGNSLSLSGGDLTEEIKFERSGSNQQTASAPSKKTASPEPKAGGQSIVGEWVGYGETISFNQDGSCIVTGNQLRYTAVSGTLTLSSTSGQMAFTYSIADNRLTMSGNAQTFYYQRKGTASAATSGKIAPELVGKWCYVSITSSNSGGRTTDECVTLNADGSYYYSFNSSSSATGSDQYGNQTFAGGTASQDSDQGTWTFDGTTLFANSQTKGQTTYIIEKRNHPKNGDPMLIIGGRSFVTYYQRAGW